MSVEHTAGAPFVSFSAAAKTVAVGVPGAGAHLGVRTRKKAAEVVTSGVADSRLKRRTD
jgi:hypothetical protein